MNSRWLKYKACIKRNSRWKILVSNLYIRSSYRVFNRNTRHCPSVLSKLRVVARFVRVLILSFFNLLLPLSERWTRLESSIQARSDTAKESLCAILKSALTHNPRCTRKLYRNLVNFRRCLKNIVNEFARFAGYYSKLLRTWLRSSTSIDS